MSDNWKNMLFFQLFISNGSNKRRLIIMDKLFCESCGSNEFEEKTVFRFVSIAVHSLYRNSLKNN